MRSIRQFLIANLLIGILFATNLAILSNLYFGYQSIRPHLDAQMVIMAHSIDLFLPNDNISHNTAQQQVVNQYKNNKTTLQDYHIHDQAYLTELQHSLNSIQFHVYSAEHTILARSPQAPEAPAALKTGFTTTQIHGEQWRVFKLITPSKKTVIIFHPMHARQYIQDNINTKAIIMTLLTIPPLGLFLWVIISRSLVSIGETSAEIKQRAHNNLKPIDTASIPIEIQPLINEINSLFQRLHSMFMRESRFAADAAHELKTPLASLKIQAQVAQKLENRADVTAYLEKIIQSVDRANHTVDQLLALSRTMPDAHMREHSLVRLDSIITSVISQHYHHATQKKIDLAFDNQTQSPPSMFGHEIALQTLFSNLIDNAIRYSDMNTSVTVSLHETHSNFIANIIDQGPGIPKVLHSRVFERFYRVVGSKQSGTGLGLNIVSQIVNLHRGKISLTSANNGKGLNVTLVFRKPDPVHTDLLDLDAT